MSTENESLTEKYPGLEDSLPRSVWVYRLGVQDVIVRDCEYGVEVYKRAGETTDPEDLVEHDGPALIDGHFYHVEESEYGAIQAYHPFAGRGPRLEDELTDWQATMLSEVERVV
jgi:hypothetical protein